MKNLILHPAAIFLSVSLIAQTDNVGVGTNTPTTRLTVNGAISSIPSNAPAANTVTIPANVSIFRLTAVAGTQANALTSASPQEGQYLTIYNQDNDPATFAGHTIAATNGVGTFVYLNGAWRLAANAPGGGPLTGWSTTGNAGTNPAVNFIGTTDAQPLKFRVNNFPAGEIGANTGLGGTALENITTGTENAALGAQALRNTTTGSQNVAIGDYALQSNTGTDAQVAVGYEALNQNTTGSSNTALGHQTLKANISGNDNTAGGYRSLFANTTGSDNTAYGSASLYLNTTGKENTALGSLSLVGNTTGDGNIAVGYRSLQSNTTGMSNVALGAMALYNNTDRSNLVAVGDSAMYSNTSGEGNTAVGSKALFDNTTGYRNTAIGFSASRSNSTGNNNTAVGYEALRSNTGGSLNTAIGVQSLRSNTTGLWNTAVGVKSLRSNTTGSGNTAVGFDALDFNFEGEYNTAIGNYALGLNGTGSDNTAIGVNSMYFNSTGSLNVAVGRGSGFGNASTNYNKCTFVGAHIFIDFSRTNVSALGYGIGNAQCTGDNQVLLGNTAVSQIRAQVGSITTYSDARFKSHVSDDVVGLPFITKLRPVSYNQNPEILHQIWGTPDSLVRQIDHSEIKQKRFVGLIAQEVEQAMKESGYAHFPGIDIPKNSNETYSLRYGDLIVPMIKAMQEQQKIIEAQENTINRHEALISEQSSQLQQLTQRIASLERMMSVSAK